MQQRMSIAEFRSTKLSAPKYRNKKTLYKGDMYDSKKEADYAKILDVLMHAAKPAECVVSYDRQVAYRLEINGKFICKYLADFVVRYADGREEVVDVKGVRTDVYKIKNKMMKVILGIDIVEK